MGLHRTFLFLLVVGLIIAAFRRSVVGRVSPSEIRQGAPPADATRVSAAPAPTNSAAGRGLAATGPDAHE